MYGSFLREIRVSRGLSQTELASLVGMEQPNLSAYEQGRRVPTIQTVHRIATACGFRLVAEAGDRRVPLPVASDDDGRLDDDPPDEPPVVPRDADAETRGRALEQALRLAEATRGHR
jgi:transcriptional regulator with XRE-family HTH domain